MPLVRYTWLHEEGHKNIEEALLPATDNPRESLLENEPVLRGKPERLISVEVLNPLIHEHDWRKTIKQFERQYYRCAHCGVISWRRFSVVYGPVGPYTRDEAYKPVRYEKCRSPLKEMPPSTSLFK